MTNLPSWRPGDHNDWSLEEIAYLEKHPHAYDGQHITSLSSSTNVVTKSQSEYRDPKYEWINITCVGDVEPQFLQNTRKLMDIQWSNKWKCIYCGCLQRLDRVSCEKCGAPRR